MALRPDTALPLSYRSTSAPGGIRTRDLSIRVDNRNRSGPQQSFVAVVQVRSACGVEPLLPDNRTASARVDFQQARQASNPDQRGWSSPCSRLHHGPEKQESGRPGSNGPLRVGSPVLFRLSYVRQVVRPAGVEPAASAVAEQRSVR
jgi:hypothetical protein